MAHDGIGAIEVVMKTLCRAERHPAHFAMLVLIVVSLAAIEFGSPLAAACLLLLGFGFLCATELVRTPNWKGLLSRALESNPAGLCIYGPDLRVIMSNGHFGEMYGLTEEQVKPGTTFEEILRRRSRAVRRRRCHAGYVEAYADPATAAPEETVHELLDGRIVSVSHRAMSDGGLVEVHRDITGEWQAEERADRAMQALIEKQYAIDQAVIVGITDVKGKITYANENFCRISGYAKDELIGQNHRLLKSGFHSTELFRDMYRTLARGKVWRGELCNRAKSGRLYWVDTVITPQLGPDGKPISYMAIRIDITARKEAEAKISFAATHDSLTSLLNRSALLNQAKAVLMQADGKQNHFGVYLLDLDGFKGVNDTLGHHAGDHLLRQVATRLGALTEVSDLVARLGGDEFAIVRRSEGPIEEDSLDFSRRLVEAMAAPFEIDEHPIHISTSVGIAFSPDHGGVPQELLKKADLALYAAKASGRNCFRIYQPAMLEAVEGEKELEAELREALARGEFELHYQPILSAATRTVCAAEALVRWRHPERGLIPPTRFIAVAEQTGLILPLGEWIIGQACRDAASWPPHIKLAVNVSAIQFKRGNLFEVVMEALLQSGLSPERLEIEVTETAVLEHRPEQLQTFRKLKNIGVELVLDDFGTGYSSASYVTNFPFDKIKIDKSFVQGFDTRRECAAIISSAVALAKGLDITITAEGIESEAQFAALRAVEVDHMQGYLFGRPVPSHVFIDSQPMTRDFRHHEVLTAKAGHASRKAGKY
jgi:diguanylate cyclase (GGDEF)-like protein/PAS domain S-box-containing protein